MKTAVAFAMFWSTASRHLRITRGHQSKQTAEHFQNLNGPRVRGNKNLDKSFFAISIKLRFKRAGNHVKGGRGN
jgi:hypothetical protein